MTAMGRIMEKWSWRKENLKLDPRKLFGTTDAASEFSGAEYHLL